MHFNPYVVIALLVSMFMEARQGTLIALLGNVYSFAIATACGVWVNPNAVVVWNI
jgi:hypothetical protein